MKGSSYGWTAALGELAWQATRTLQDGRIVVPRSIANAALTLSRIDLYNR